MTFGLAVFVFTYLLVGQWAALTRMGSNIFAALGAFGLMYALLAGPLATVDCISRERREGTLGLMFLTNLHSYDVVLGKIAVASLDMILGLLAVLPLLALPLLMGGITLLQFARLVLALGNVTFLSLALGICVSCIITNGRAGLAILVGSILWLTFGAPFLVEGIGNVAHNSAASAFLYMACPLYTFELCLSIPFRAPAWKFWLNMGGLQALAWVGLTVACWRTAKSWRDVPGSAFVQRCRQRIEKWRRGPPKTRIQWGRLMMDRNPISWLEGRDRLQERILWALFLCIAIFFACKRLYSPTWPTDGFVVLWAWLAHSVLCFWIALQSPRRLADDKQSGALEILLCTPLSTHSIIRGNMQALQRRYGRVFFGLLMLDAFLLYAHFSSDGGWDRFLNDDTFQLSLWALIVFPVQTYTLARLGLLHGLIQPNSLRGSFVSIWKVGLLPWISFFVFVLACDIASRRFKIIKVNDTFAYTSWAGAHVLPCVIFLMRANRRLKHEFRTLALPSVHQHWWQRFHWPRNAVLLPAPTHKRASPLVG